MSLGAISRNPWGEAQRRILDEVLWITGSGAPSNGTSGTGVNIAGPGSEYTDTATGNAYVNLGTKASPTWFAVGNFSKELSFTAAQVKAIRATPQTLVAAPGAGLVLEFVSLELYLDYGGSNVFAESTANFAVKYTDGSGVAVSQTIENTGFIDQAADTRTNGLPKIDQIVAKTGCENQALVLHNIGAGEITGNAANDNVLRAKVNYRVWPTGW